MMMQQQTPAPRRLPDGDVTLSRAMRFEFADEENRALLGSYAIATAIGVAFLVLQQFGPRPEPPRGVFEQRHGPIVFTPSGVATEPSLVEAIASAVRGRAGRGDASVRSSNARAGTGPLDASAINAAFGVHSGGMPGDVAGLLRGVAVHSGTGNAGSGGKTVLGVNQGGVGSALPGRGGMGTSPTGSGGMGAVGTRAGVSRSAVVVAGPVAIPVAGLPSDARNVGDLGTFVRGHQAELRFCYEESGLKMDPSLGGTIMVAMTIAGSGIVNDATVTRRSWSGAAAAATESCILRAVRGWRLPPTDRGAGTYTFPFSFTR